MKPNRSGFHRRVDPTGGTGSSQDLGDPTSSSDGTAADSYLRSTRSLVWWTWSASGFTTGVQPGSSGPDQGSPPDQDLFFFLFRSFRRDSLAHFRRDQLAAFTRHWSGQRAALVHERSVQSAGGIYSPSFRPARGDRSHPVQSARNIHQHIDDPLAVTSTAIWRSYPRS